MQLRATILASLFVATTTTAAAADPKSQLPAIDLGLWKWTTTVISGAKMPTPAQLDQMPEPVREAMLAHMKTALQPRTSQGCLTEQKLTSGFNLRPSHDDCTFRVNASSPTGFDELTTCHTRYFGVVFSHITFSVADRQTLHGTVEIHSSEDPAPETIKLEGKRLNADCGSVMP